MLRKIVSNIEYISAISLFTIIFGSIPTLLYLTLEHGLKPIKTFFYVEEHSNISYNLFNKFIFKYPIISEISIIFLFNFYTSQILPIKQYNIITENIKRVPFLNILFFTCIDELIYRGYI